jgi:hypothetical protein
LSVCKRGDLLSRQDFENAHAAFIAFDRGLNGCRRFANFRRSVTDGAVRVVQCPGFDRFFYVFFYLFLVIYIIAIGVTPSKSFKYLRPIQSLKAVIASGSVF